MESKSGPGASVGRLDDSAAGLLPPAPDGTLIEDPRRRITVTNNPNTTINS